MVLKDWLKTTSVIFLIRGESFFTGIYFDFEKLYKYMIDAFNRVIAKYTKGELG